MFINITCGYGFHEVDAFKTLISVYGTHLSIIIAFYFNTTDISNRTISTFRFLFFNVLMLFWNFMIFIIIYASEGDYKLFTDRLTEFPQYAGFLIAIGIIWLFNSNSSSNN